jgi:hypothetical protein
VVEARWVAGIFHGHIPAKIIQFGKILGYFPPVIEVEITYNLFFAIPALIIFKMRKE